MRVEFVILADAAQSVENKLYILGGGWNVYRSIVFPVDIRIGIAIGITLEPDEIGPIHDVSISLVDEAGQAIANVGLGIASGPTEVPGSEAKALLALDAPLIIPHAGRYSVTVRAGDSTATATFHAVNIRSVVAMLPPTEGPKP